MNRLIIFLVIVIVSCLPNPASAQNSSLQSGKAGDYFRLKLSEVRLKQGDKVAALKLAERVDSKALAFWKSVVMAECFLAEGNYQKVLKELSKLPPRPNPDLSFEETFYAKLYKRALLGIKAAKLSLGQNADYETAELAANYPMDADVANCQADLSVEQKVVKLHALFFANQHSLINDIITPEEIVKSRLPHNQKCSALYDLGYGLRRRSGSAAVAVAAFQGILDQKCGHNLETRALYWIGSLGTAAGLDDAADKALLRLGREFKGHRLQDDAFYLLYKRAQRRGQPLLVQKYADELMGLQKGDMRDKLAFDLAFPYYMKKEFEKAAKILKPLINDKSSEESLSQVLYWYARALQKMGGRENLGEARKIFEKIISDYPFSFYAVLASISADITAKIPALPKLKGSPPTGNDGLFDLIGELEDKGLYDAASQMMDLAMNLNPSWEETHREFVARKYIEVQNYRKALDMAAKYFNSGVYGPVEPQSDPMFAAFFPVAFPDEVSAGYRLTGLPRGAIEGIIREESLFQRSVRSHAGAVGLMQLMPGTAAMMARGNAGGASASKLTNPSDNVLLGSSYLASMLDRFGNRMPFAIMAYNAGPGNVNKFMRSLGGLELDAFIENIPISETRGYVKRVMRSQQVYGSIYGEKIFNFLNEQLRDPLRYAHAR